MEMRFMGSVQMALQMAIQLERGTLSVWPENHKHGDEFLKPEKPDWESFIFFDRIRATQIKAFTGPGAYYDSVERTVQFFHFDSLVVSIWLHGRGKIGPKGPAERLMWTTGKLSYFLKYCANGVVEDWKEIPLNTSGFRSSRGEVQFLAFG